jgi:hypothetical protein
MRRKLEAVKRELRASGQLTDRESYRSLMNVRATVDKRYDEAIRWLRQQGRDEEARRFELMHRNLPLVRSEKQLLAEGFLQHRSAQKRPDGDQDRRR